jgi:hypothetical protein
MGNFPKHNSTFTPPAARPPSGLTRLEAHQQQRNTPLNPSTIAFAAGLGLSLAGCDAAISPTQIANVACIGAQAGAAVAVTVTADANANAGLNATNAAAQAQGTASAIGKTVADACPIIVTGVNAINSASKTSLSAGK